MVEMVACGDRAAHRFVEVAVRSLRPASAAEADGGVPIAGMSARPRAAPAVVDEDEVELRV
jgi:hypothetical protein